MPITPIGNLNYVNQNAALPSTQASNELAKEGFASLANLNEFQEKERSVDKLEKVAQSNAIDEEIKEKADEEEKRKKKEEQEHEEKDEENAQAQNEEEEEEEMNLQVDESEESRFKKSHQIHRLDISI